MKKFILFLAAALLILGMFYGIQKVLTPEAEDLPSPTSTWFSANLPGATQHCFLRFDRPEEFTNLSTTLVDGSVYLESGSLFYKNGKLDPNTLGTLQTDSEDAISVLPDYLREYQDVIVCDFDFTLHSGDPNIRFSLDDSGGQLLWRNKNEGSEKIYFGSDTTLERGVVYHITFLYFESDSSCNVYINGAYDSTFTGSFSAPSLTFYGTVWAEETTAGLMSFDNIEVTTFGNGDGSYDGILKLYKENTSLNIGELMGAK